MCPSQQAVISSVCESLVLLQSLAATLEVSSMQCTPFSMMHMLSAGAAGALFVYNRDCQSQHNKMVKQAVSNAMMGS